MTVTLFMTPNKGCLREMALQTKLEHFLCTISKLSTLFEKKIVLWSKLPEKLKDGIKILTDQMVFWVVDLNNILHVWINISRNVSLLYILMPLYVFLRQDNHIIFQKSVDNCDTIWENLPHVAHGNFAEINKIILKLLCISLFLINFDNTWLWM